MRRNYGSWLRRALCGGVTLRPVEAALMEGFVAGVPQEIGEPLAAQLKAINCARRSRGGRELRFERLRGLRADRAGLPPLPVAAGATKLMEVAFSVPGCERALRAAFWAADRQFARVEFSEDLGPFRDAVPRVTGVEASWQAAILRARAP
jgi:hypothetical protein